MTVYLSVFHFYLCFFPQFQVLRFEILEGPEFCLVKMSTSSASSAAAVVALKHISENLKRELSGLVDDLCAASQAKLEEELPYANSNGSANAGEKVANVSASAIDHLVSELKEVTVKCVEGRREFSENVGKGGDATEKLVAVLKKEVHFLKLRLSRELQERESLGSQMGALERERQALEDQSRKIEKDIDEASESNARLEVAFSKTKRLVTNLRDSIDWANIIKEKDAAAMPSSEQGQGVKALPDLEEEEEKALPGIKETPAVGTDVGAKEDGNQNDVDHLGSAFSLEPIVSTSPDFSKVQAKETKPLEVQSTSPEEQEVEVEPQPVQFPVSEAFDANVTAGVEVTAVAPSVKAETEEKPPAPAAAAAPAEFDAFGSTDVWGAGFPAASTSTTTVTASAEALPSEVNTTQVNSDVSEIVVTTKEEEEEVQDKEAPPAPPAPAPAQFDAVGSTDLWGASNAPAASVFETASEPNEAPKEQSVQQQEATPQMSEDLFGFRDSAFPSTSMEPQASASPQWQDMDLFEPLDLQATQDTATPVATTTTISMPAVSFDNNANANANANAFEPDAWASFGDTTQGSNPVDFGSDANGDLLGWGQPSNQESAPGQSNIESEPKAATIATDAGGAATWAQFDSPPPFWNDLPAPTHSDPSVGTTISFGDSDLLPSTEVSANAGAGANQFDVDFFNVQGGSGESVAPSVAPSVTPGNASASQQSTDLFGEPQSQWGEGDPFQTQQAAPAPAPGNKTMLRRMSEVEIRKCDQAFAKLVGNTSSSASKEELLKYYSLTQLPETIFSKIWSLTDPNDVGKVSLKQFYLFMYFMTAAVKGSELPQTISNEDIELILGSNAAGGLSASSPPGSATAPAKTYADPKLKQLVELGFDESQAKNALAAAGNDVEAAANYLFSNFTGDAAAARPGQAAPSQPPTSSASAAPSSTPAPTGAPVVLSLLQISSEVSKSPRIFLQVKVLGPNGNSLEQNNMVQVTLGKKGFSTIERTLALTSSFESLVQQKALITFEVKKEKKRSMVTKAWGVLDVVSARDIILTQGSSSDSGGGQSSSGNLLRVPLSSKKIDLKKYQNKVTVVKGSSTQVMLKLTW